MNVLQNDVCSTLRYVKIQTDSSTSTAIIHNSYVQANKFNIRKLPRISGPQWLDQFDVVKR